jgi:hypothetical protein
MSRLPSQFPVPVFPFKFKINSTSLLTGIHIMAEHGLNIQATETRTKVIT